MDLLYLAMVGLPVGLLVGSMDLTLELTLCAVQIQTQRAQRLKELCVQDANEHNAQQVLAWWYTELALQQSSYCRIKMNEHYWHCASMCPEEQRLMHNGTAQQKLHAEAE